MFSEPLRDVNRKQPPQRVDTQYVAIASRPQDGSVESEMGLLHFPGALPFSFISLTLFGQSFFPAWNPPLDIIWIHESETVTTFFRHHITSDT